MTVRRHALDRAARGIRISSPIASERRKAMLAVDELAEREQQFQLPISGHADEAAAFAVVELVFDTEFFDAPEMRDSSLRYPQFWYGFFIDPTDQGEANPTGAVIGTACVSEWVQDTRGAFTGAKVTVGACVPGGGGWDYTGYVHLSFQGFGAPAENAPDLDVGT